ncbi:MAG: 4-carboxymuconolactone decarboxylase [Nocardioidaceae bacterium]|nr:4-carboxymuconolactone decarboxylase [Nocardioidaceae bacterium]
MTVPRLTAVRLGGSSKLPLLVLGPSLGASAQALWSPCAPALAERFEVLAWDLPGHGTNTSAVAPFTIEELATAVLDLVDDMLAERGQQGVPFAYAGESAGGAVGLALLLAAPQRVEAAVMVCTGAKLGTADGWVQRAAAVRASGTPSLVSMSAERWFGPGFVEREPDVASALLHALSEVDDEGYALVCQALAGFDVRDRLGEIRTPVLAIAGSDDVAAPPAGMEELANGVRDGRLVVLDGVAHLAPAERPAEVADLVVRHLSGQPLEEPMPERRAAGYAVRREVLGNDHVDRAIAGTTDLTRDFQELITDYAWGSVWTRPGLDRRSRSMITLTALVAGGHHDELRLHLRAALRNGLTVDEIKEVLVQSAIYCGVPAANTAFRIAQEVIEEVLEQGA